jgi:glutathione synthase
MRVAVQMDPIETINIGGDSSFALMLEAQARGATLIHYMADDLSAENGRVRAKARPLKVINQAGAHYEWLGDPRTVDLADEADVVLMRQDPPFDMGYITATHLLEQIQDRVLVVNDPAEVRNAPEKLFVLRFPDLMPPTLVTKSLEEAMDFRARHGAIVVKPLYGNAGTAVFLIDKNDGNLPALVELFSSVWREPFMVQAFLPSVAEGDKRIVLVDGEPAGAINRLPKKGEIRSNLAAGGSAKGVPLSERDKWICNEVGPSLKAKGLIFVGLDVIGDFLTEINVTSPTCVRELDAAFNLDIAGDLMSCIAGKLGV